MLLVTAPASANDSMAEFKTGGLVLTKTSDIEMRSEDLYLSTDEIRVRYRFLNRTGNDLTTEIAFPMPDVALPEHGEPLALPANATDNFLGFTTTVDGRPVPASLEQHAMVRGSDETDALWQVGAPLLPQLDSTADYLNGLSADKQKRLVALGLAERDEETAGRDEHKLRPSWTLRSMYHWQQTFPANREITVEHRYQPSVGGSAGTMLTAPDANDTDYIRRYCIEPSFLASIRRAKERSGDYAPFSEQRISYILKSGANWARPIGDFRLVVNKGSASNLVSFCGTGVRKIGPRQFEMRKQNFLPEADIDVLIMVPNRG